MERSRRRVLVIDDDPHLGRLVARMLDREHNVTVMTSVREALDQIGAGERFEVILCDLMMPGLTGVDFHEGLQQIAPELLNRVVVMTGGAFTPRSRAFLEQPSIRQLEKPFGLAELQHAVRRHMP